MPARPSFDSIPPTEAEAEQLLDRSLRRARAIETLSAESPTLSLLSVLLVFFGAGVVAYALSMQSEGQFALAWVAAFGAFMSATAYGQVRDLRARVNALQELLRQAEAERS
jgi:membrane associated rhomboid family serine protease